MEEIRKYISTELDYIEDFYLNLALDHNTEYEKVYKAKLEDLPILMGTGYPLINELISLKLNGETTIASPVYTHQAIWDVNLDSDELNDIHYYDGKIAVLQSTAKLLGFDDLTERAGLCQYSYE